ncbi:MAG TPA: RdgB/HAM1 family non-canonical purine NTP pyrophosphatase [Acidimicrobiales bacterium]|nr:RdgB/HAM1 family non-canonical purine NTP pyrophosphatase [Acidimicrobiales bacterium]
MNGTITLVAATANPDKAEEIREILGGAHGLVLLPRPPDVPEVAETGATLVENARLKAAALAEATGLPAVSDDTGLEVDALDGAPGVFAARYAGAEATYADNVAKLLTNLAARPDPGGSRRARFRTVAMVRFPDGRELWREGVVEGVIADAPRGEGGFGYDPVFVPDDADGRTFAELGPAEKHAISHRGRAFRALSDALRAEGFLA